TEMDGLRYRVEWRPLADVSGSATLSGRWLMVEPAGFAEDPWAQAVFDALAAGGAEVERVAYDAATDRAQLAARLEGEASIAGVVSLLALSGDLNEEDGVPAGVSGSVALLQALGDAGVTAPLWAVTRGAVSVGRSDGPVDAVQGAVWGLGRVAALEAADRWGGLIDLPTAIDRRTAGRLAAVLSGVGDEDQVAVRVSGVF
ncbi:polyketide synthase, partial [Streptomyces sp. HD]|nr:polyketide synthase [Streptomyces sp. HD]